MEFEGTCLSHLQVKEVGFFETWVNLIQLQLNTSIKKVFV
jgi:hypothetical protein